MLASRVCRTGWPRGALAWVLGAGLVLGVGLSGCGLINLFQEDCLSAISLPPASDEPLSPISAGLRYLVYTQFKTDQTGRNQVAYAGDWPQCYTMAGTGMYVRDTNPFMATYVHHALTLARAEHQAVLQLTDAEIEVARNAREAAVGLMRRFESPADSPDAGTFGFWPVQRRSWQPGDVLLSMFVNDRWSNWSRPGDRAPVNVSFFPANHAIPSDADDTALVYASFLDHATFDGGPAVTVGFEQFFADWRDLGQVPLGEERSWLGSRSGTGAYLTWLAYLDDPARPELNHLDIVVNANVLYALGRYGRLDTPGATDAVALINEAILANVHRTDPDQLSLFYPDNIAVHHCVARAYCEGGVSDLAPAVQGLVADLLTTVRADAAGHYYWDRGYPHLNTALAVLALLNAGHTGQIVDRAVDYLVAEQDPVYGPWDGGEFFGARLNDIARVNWVSPALTTAMAIEALMAHRIMTSSPSGAPRFLP